MENIGKSGNNINNGQDNEKSFADIEKEAQRLAALEEQEYDSYSYDSYKNRLSQKNIAGTKQELLYSQDKYFNDRRRERLAEAAKHLKQFSDKYDYRYKKLVEPKDENDIEAGFHNAMAPLFGATHDWFIFPSSVAMELEEMSRKASDVDRIYLPSSPEQLLYEVEKLSVQFDEILRYPQSEKPENGAEMLNQIAGDLYTLQAELQLLKGGALDVPGENEKTENGKTIHRIDGTGAAMKGTYTVETRSGEEVQKDIEYADRSDASLFPHYPEIEDIEQGSLGDCYLLAGLTAIIKDNPELIMQAIHENDPADDPDFDRSDQKKMRDRKRTVTVRFFNDDDEPVYVTVDKTVPRTQDGEDAYSKNCLWVQMVEKAYAQSGLHNKKLIGKQDNQDYDNLESGNPSKFIRRFLGRGNGPVKGSSSSTTWSVSKDEFSKETDYSAPYTDNENKLFNRIKEACDERKIVTTSTNPAFDPKKVKLNGFSGDSVGLVENHAYSVTGTAEHDGHKYVIVRNPHNKSGLTPGYKAGEALSPDRSARGYSYIELHDYGKFFNSLSISNYDLSGLQKDSMLKAQRIAKRFGTVVQRISDALNGTTNFVRKHTTDSEEFTQFRHAAAKAAAVLGEKEPNIDLIKKSMNELFEKAATYDTKRCPATKFNSKSSFNSLERYKMTKVVELLKGAFESVNPSVNVTFAALTEKAVQNSPILVDKPSSGYEHAMKIKNDAKTLAAGVTKGLQDGSTVAGDVKKLLGKVIRLADKDVFSEFSPGRISKMSIEKKADFIKNDVREDLTLLTLLTNHTDTVIDAMLKTGTIVNGSAAEKELRFKAEQYKPLLSACELALDGERYRLHNMDTKEKSEACLKLPGMLEASQKRFNDFQSEKKRSGLEQAVSEVERKKFAAQASAAEDVGTVAAE